MRFPPDRDPALLGHSLYSWKELLTVNTLEVLKRLIGTKTIWGVAILLLNSTVLKHAPLSEAVGTEIAQSLTALLDAIGAALAVWGRLTAKEPILVASVK